jgi:putative transposon-encoded protein
MTEMEINIKDQILTLMENLETVYDQTVTPFGNSVKVDVAKKYIEKRVYVIVLREWRPLSKAKYYHTIHIVSYLMPRR